MKHKTIIFIILLLFFLNSCSFIKDNLSSNDTTNSTTGNTFLEEQKQIKEKFNAKDPLDKMPDIIYEGNEINFNYKNTDWTIQNSNLGYVLKKIVVGSKTADVSISTYVSKYNMNNPDDSIADYYQISVLNSDLIESEGEINDLEITFSVDSSLYLYPNLFKNDDIKSITIYSYESHTNKNDLYSVHKGAFADIDFSKTDVEIEFDDGSFKDLVKYFWFILPDTAFSNFRRVSLSVTLEVDVQALNIDGAIRVSDAYIDYYGSWQDPIYIENDSAYFIIDVTGDAYGYEITPWNVALYNYVLDTNDYLFYDAYVDYEIDFDMSFTVSNFSPFHYKTYSFDEPLNSNCYKTLKTGVSVLLTCTLDFYE